jgi:hypothetical protein
MSTSPLDPQDIRAAAEVHRELGPEYSDAVVAAFIDRVDRAVAARVEARLAEERRHQPAASGGRRALLKGVALGVCASALVAGVSISQTHAAGAYRHSARVLIPRSGLRPGQGELGPGQGVPRPPAIPPPPAGVN